MDASKSFFYPLLVLSTLDFRLLTAKLWVWWQMFTPSCSNCEVSSLWPSAGSNPLFTWPHPTFTQLKVYAIQHKVGFAQQGTCACLVPCQSQAVINPCKARIPWVFPCQNKKNLNMLKTCNYWFHGSPMDSSNQYLRFLSDRDPSSPKV